MCGAAALERREEARKRGLFPRKINKFLSSKGARCPGWEPESRAGCSSARPRGVMPDLQQLLPSPKYASVAAFDKKDFAFGRGAAEGPRVKEPPPYLARQSYRPREPADYGDGGAFPEIHVMQYPLNMGRKDREADSVAPLRVDAQGNVKYDVVVRSGARSGKVVHTELKDMLEKSDDSEDDLAKPDEAEIAKLAEKTQVAMGKIIDKKMMAKRPSHIDTQDRSEPVFIRYTPSQAVKDATHNSGASQRIIKLQEVPKDPMEPPKFRVKKLPARPPSPPVPVMHSPPRKVTAEDQANWKIPPCISNWKNIKGYVIPLDKRMAADGRGLKEVQINDKFATFSEALYIAEREARKDILVRSQMLKSLATQKKKQKEEQFRELAMKAREAVRGAAAADASPSASDSDTREARDKREMLRRERRREIQRDIRLENARQGKEGKAKRAGTRSGFGRDEERDVSEKIALGQAVNTSRDAMFDQRLFNQDAGMSAGFGANDGYNLYSKPLMNGSSANTLYRPPKDLQKEVDADQNMKSILETGTARFRPDRGFKGADEQIASSARNKPVEFEKAADPYGLGQFMSSVRGGAKGKNSLSSIGKQGFMSASGGSAGRSKDDYGGVHPDRLAQMGGFREASAAGSSTSSRKRSRDQRDAGGARSRSRDRERRRRR